MKKILFLFMMIATMFAFSASADTLKISNSQSFNDYIDGNISKQNDVAYVKVNILHKDTLIYSFNKSGQNNIRKEISGDLFASSLMKISKNAQSASHTTLASVSQEYDVEGEKSPIFIPT